MMPALMPSERSIFLEAIEIPSLADRARFVDRQCDGNPRLHSEVMALLQAHDDTGGVLDAPSAAERSSRHGGPIPVTMPSISEGPGTIIGPYTLLEQIGEGGMGTVFVAEQRAPVQRQVALKIIKPGMDSQSVISRFRTEQQVLALMDHPHIASVFDAGTTDSGRPYFVMELVRGVAITTYCDEHRLSPAARLELFIGVCQAVQHAHQKGIIHRDIKPSNVLVTVYDGKAVPKVIDFGVARATGPGLDERPPMTQIGAVLGTLEYMSPEQAGSHALDIDTRSDIYSLGVLLYELLTGTTPLDRTRLGGAALAEVLRMIRDDEPQKPSTRLSASHELRSIAANRSLEPGRLSGMIRGDLDWIVMKALEKDRDRRYETANGVGLDIRRYLSHEAVDACPPSRWYRFRTFARRNRAMLVSTAFVSLALVTAVVVLAISTLLTSRAYEAERLAHQRAETNFERARQAVNEQMTIVSQSTLFDVPGLQPVRKDLLEAAVRYYRELATEHAADPVVLADLALACLRLCEVDFELCNMDDAVAVLRDGLDLAEQLHSQYPNDRASHLRLAGYWNGNRRTVRASLPPTDHATAEAILLRFIQLWEAFVRENPGANGFRSDLANVYSKLGLLQSAREIHQESVRYTRQAIALWEDLHREAPDNRLYRDALVVAYGQLRHCLMNSGLRQEEEAAGLKTISLSEGLVADFPDVPQYRLDLAAGLLYFGTHCAATRRTADAEAAYRRAASIARELLTRFPATPAAIDVLSSSSRNLMGLAWGLGASPEEFAKLRQELIRVMEGIAAENRNRPDELARATAAFAYLDLSRYLADNSRNEAAESACRESITLYEGLATEFPAVRDYRLRRVNAAEVLANLLRNRESNSNFPPRSR